MPPAAGPPPDRPLASLPWQFLVRATLVVTGLTLLLIVDVRGALFYVAWSMIVVALLSEAVATVLYRRQSR